MSKEGFQEKQLELILMRCVLCSDSTRWPEMQSCPVMDVLILRQSRFCTVFVEGNIYRT